MRIINTLPAMRRPALEPTTSNDIAETNTYYSLYGLNSQLDEILCRMKPGWYWLHYGDYDSFKDAMINGRHLYAYRIIKCDLIYDGQRFWGIKGTNIL